MSIETPQQLENTRVKLQELEQFYTKIRQGPGKQAYTVGM